ncbi:MAG: DUF3108 domain-containing protein [Bacteroidota bacterium]
MKTFSLHFITIVFLSLLPLYYLWNIEPQERIVRQLEIHDSTVNTGFLQVGEELTYEASWWFIKLGAIRTKVLSEQTKNGDKSYACIAYINSYSGIPFVNLHAIFQSVLDNECYSQSFVQREQEGTSWEVLRYRYERQKNIIFIDEGITENDTSDIQIQKIDTAAIDIKTQDGLSLLYFARANVKSEKPFTVPTMIRHNQGTTVLNFPGKNTSVEIDAVQYPIDVIEFDGDAKFNGIFGFNGSFKGWFSNDGAQIPIKAKTSVIIGSITIELIQWTRPGWKPPRAVE